jgi:hypothetical protein
MAIWGSFTKDSLWFEIEKLVAQLGIITGFDAIVTLLVHEFQRDQEEAQQRVADEQRRAEVRQQWLRSILTRTSTAYTDLKQARRTLQAAVPRKGAVDGGLGLRVDVYYEQLAGISEVHADFENLDTEVMSYVSQDAPQGVEAEVAQQLQLIKNWLSDLVKEWKDYPKPVEEVPPSTVAVSALPKLRLFVARSEEPEFTMVSARSRERTNASRGRYGSRRRLARGQLLRIADGGRWLSSYATTPLCCGCYLRSFCAP